MKSKNTIIYVELFKIINKHFEKKFGRKLVPRCFRMDCEAAVLRAINTVYGSVKMRLCIIHILRNWRKKFIEYVGKPQFLKNILFKNAWNILRGVFFLPYPALKIVINYFLTVTVKALPRGLKGKFKQFVTDYLVKRYFSTTATYPNWYWSYFHDINDFATMNYSTNSAEVINRILKVKTGNGKVVFRGACRILKDFKEDYISDFHWKVTLNHLNPRLPVTIAREQFLLDLVREYDDLPFLQQTEISNVINYAAKFSTVNYYAFIIPTVENPEDPNTNHSDIVIEDVPVPIEPVLNDEVESELNDEVEPELNDEVEPELNYTVL